ncbi:MAG: phosphate-starvation-inducible PsiE family protein [Hungatella sp.]
MAAILLVVILAGAILLAVNLTGDLIHNPQLVDLNQVLGDALALVVGIEFIKMLVKHAPEAVVEVLLFAIAREMVVTHAGSAETLMGVIAVGIIFLIRHYLCPPKPARGEGGQAE